MNQIQESHIAWADTIFAMEHEHAKVIRQRFRDSIDATPIVVLNIPDEFAYMDPELIELLELSVESL